MTRDYAVTLLAAFIDAAKTAGNATHISLYLQGNKLAMLAHPMQFATATDGEILISSHPVIEVNHNQQVVGRVSTGDHEIPARATDSVCVAQALLGELEDNLTGLLFA